MLLTAGLGKNHFLLRFYSQSTSGFVMKLWDREITQFPGITEAPFSSLGVAGKQLRNPAHISNLAPKLEAPFANLTLRGRRKPEARLLSAVLCCSMVLKTYSHSTYTKILVTVCDLLLTINCIHTPSPTPPPRPTC